MMHIVNKKDFQYQKYILRLPWQVGIFFFLLLATAITSCVDEGRQQKYLDIKDLGTKSDLLYDEKITIDQFEPHSVISEPSDLDVYGSTFFEDFPEECSPDLSDALETSEEEEEVYDGNIYFLNTDSGSGQIDDDDDDNGGLMMHLGQLASNEPLKENTVTGQISSQPSLLPSYHGQASLKLQGLSLPFDANISMLEDEEIKKNQQQIVSQDEVVYPEINSRDFIGDQLVKKNPINEKVNFKVSIYDTSSFYGSQTDKYYIFFNEDGVQSIAHKRVLGLLSGLQYEHVEIQADQRPISFSIAKNIYWPMVPAWRHLQIFDHKKEFLGMFYRGAHFFGIGPPLYLVYNANKKLIAKVLVDWKRQSLVLAYAKNRQGILGVIDFTSGSKSTMDVFVRLCDTETVDIRLWQSFAIHLAEHQFSLGLDRRSKKR